MNILACADATEAADFWGPVPELDIQVTDNPGFLPKKMTSGAVPDAVVVRLHPGDDHFETLTRVRSAVDLPVVAWISEATPLEIFRIYSHGADALITDRCSIQERERALESARNLRGRNSEAANREPWRESLVGNSSSMRVVCELIRLISQRRCTVLITGETGTGKEMVARAIHAASPRANQPMVSLNCNAIPAELLEAELFGHVKGAYTGAFQSRTGRFEQANKGTLFLDEIGDLPFPLQAKLLRVLQEREVHRLGSSDTVKVDVRVIAATNANLQRLVEEGKFRQDLYYRLHVAPIHLPPLRERMDDVPLLAAHFVEKVCRAERISLKSLTREVVESLQCSPWPGNIRELENVIESAIAVSGDRPALRMSDFPALLGRNVQHSQLFAMPEEGIDYNSIVGQFERTLLSEALRLADGSKKRAASLLGLKRTTFSAKLDALQIGEEADEEGDEASNVTTCYA